MTQFGVGQPVARVEDPRLLTGRGRYIGDISLPGETHAAFVRAPHAHADILAIDATAARAAPGVIAVLTEADLAADRIGPLTCMMPLKGKDGAPMPRPPRPLLARGRVRFVGEAVAMVVAETLAAARDGAERVRIDYAPLPAVTDTRAAAAPDAPHLRDDVPGNLLVEIARGDANAVAAAMATAAHIIRATVDNTRVAAQPMEVRGAIGQHDPGTSQLTLYANVQGPFRIRQMLAQSVFNLPEAMIRVMCRDMGGGFGARGDTYPEQGLVLWAARRIGRPVKWIAERGETFLSDNHGRDTLAEGALALDKDGRLLALEVRTLTNMGAYLATMGPVPTINALSVYTGLYDIPALHIESRCVFSNTNPTSPYRGAGRPEAIYLLERLIDRAARATGIDRAELRRRNLIPPSAIPYRNAADNIYDSGDFPANMEQALAAANWDGFEARRAEAASRGKLRGMGIANYVERCGGETQEWTELRFDPSGTLNILHALFGHGQGHETVFAQMAVEALGVPFDAVRVLQGDTDRGPFGDGTRAARSMVVGSGALSLAAEKIIAKGKRIAAHAMEAAIEDIEFAKGRFTIAGTDTSLSITEVARAAFTPSGLPPGEEPGLGAIGGYMSADHSYPNGCHVCEVEIDRETGALRFIGYWVVDDVGRVINPLLVDGQIHGGIAQGAGQVLGEHIVHDRESGQLLSGSFMDYPMPRADDLPPFAIAYNAHPCTTNPLGVKGAGEAGTVGAVPAVTNAIIDALSPLGINDIALPATPERIWRAIRDAAADPGPHNAVGASLPNPPL